MKSIKAGDNQKAMRNSISAGIPKNIHLVFFDKNIEWPLVFSKCNVRLKEFHPDWNIKLYDAEAAVNIISQHFPELLPVYHSYPHYIQRADLFRVILVYLFGGFYLDLDMYCTKALDELTTYDLVLPEERSVSGKGRKWLAEIDGINIKNSFRLGNYMFGAVPGHPFWLYYLKEAIKVAGREIKHEGDILETTGPALLTRVYHKYGRLFPALVVLKNQDRHCMMPFHQEICCHFGNFAAHLHQGTWRWMYNSNGLVLQNKIDPFLLKKSQRSVDAMIRNISVGTIYLTSLSQRNKSNFLTRILHEQLAHSTFPFKKNNAYNKNKIIIVGIDSLIQEELKINNDYTIIITKDITHVSTQVVSLINKYVSRCIVFNKRMKDILKLHNVTINIRVEDVFYLPVKRDFSEDSEIMDYFSIGIFSDLSKHDLQCIEEIQNNLVTKFENYHLYIFHNQQTTGPTPKGLKYVSVNSNKLSQKLNHLSAFLNFKDDIESIQLFKTVLYLGIPCITEKCISSENSQLLKFIVLYDKEKEPGTGLSNAIQTLKKNYRKYNRKSLNASKYIEDRFSVERKSYDILKTISA